ncbi:MAG: hypothetical protein H6852_07905 [Geminicoccaceae bacterium]|jgi:hypothetical protein|nr:hypothetical protein [Geminicoccaceae bacterium]HRY25704.1 hypothetical protein [Geminicoccaceae bacterium]
MIDGRRRRYLLATLILALLLFNAPLAIVADGLGEGGYLPLYLFLGWTLVILLACLVMQWRAKS